MKAVGAQNEISQDQPKAPRTFTTIMIRNMPRKCSQDELLSEVAEHLGDYEWFDFFYVPLDKNNANKGYAFANFRDADWARWAVHLLTDYVFKCPDRRKTAAASPAHIQGLESNLRHLYDNALTSRGRTPTPFILWRGSPTELSSVFDEFRLHDRIHEAVNHSGTWLSLGSPCGATRSFSEMMDRAAGIAAGGPAAARAAALRPQAPPLQGGAGAARAGVEALARARPLPARVPVQTLPPPLAAAGPSPLRGGSSDATSVKAVGSAQIRNDKAVEIFIDTRCDDVLLKFVSGASGSDRFNGLAAPRAGDEGGHAIRRRDGF